METKLELLAPAGSYEAMTAAFAAGADAVYLGGQRFGARAYADNLDEEQLKQAIFYAKIRGKKLYLTVNTLFKDAELEELYGWLDPLYREGLDAVIVQDIGALRYIRDAFPDMAIHASTQMCVTGAYGAGFLKRLGVSRVVTARELSLQEIQSIRRQVDIEIESFVHGALCFCYSGQCLLSSMLGGRSGNRGRCAQSCRLPYDLYRQEKQLNRRDARCLLSPRDICTLDLLPELIESGICSFKIEGRMKRPEYTAGVTRVYRRCLDRFLKSGRAEGAVRPEDRRELAELYSRGGFSEGYYRKHNGAEMMSLQRSAYQTENEELLEDIRKSCIDQEKPEKINGKLILSAQKSAILTVSCQNVRAEAKGQTPQAAITRALTAEEVRKQICRTGGSGFQFEHLELEMDDGLFLPLQALNELRRTALDRLREAWKESYRRADGKYLRPCERKEAKGQELLLTASAETLDAGYALLSVPEISRIYLDCSAFADRQAFLERSPAFLEKARSAKKECYYILPWIFRTEAEGYYQGCREILNRYDGLLLRNYEEAAFLRRLGVDTPLAADWNLYTMNREAERVFREEGFLFDTAPPELNYRELAARGCSGSELIVCGCQPLMVSAQCQLKNSAGCTREPQLLRLRDRKQKSFTVKNICSFCYNVIYNAVPLDLADRLDKIRSLSPKSVRLQFTSESPAKTLRIAKAYARICFRGSGEQRVYQEFTRGHFDRGVE